MMMDSVWSTTPIQLNSNHNNNNNIIQNQNHSTITPRTHPISPTVLESMNSSPSSNGFLKIIGSSFTQIIRVTHFHLGRELVGTQPGILRDGVEEGNHNDIIPILSIGTAKNISRIHGEIVYISSSNSLPNFFPFKGKWILICRGKNALFVNNNKLDLNSIHIIKNKDCIKIAESVFYILFPDGQ